MLSDCFASGADTEKAMAVKQARAVATIHSVRKSASQKRALTAYLIGVLADAQMDDRLGVRVVDENSVSIDPVRRSFECNASHSSSCMEARLLGAASSFRSCGRVIRRANGLQRSGPETVCPEQK